MVHSVYVNVCISSKSISFKNWCVELLTQGQYQLGGQIRRKDQTASVLRDAFRTWCLRALRTAQVNIQ